MILYYILWRGEKMFFSKIDKDLSIYKNNDVFLFGASSAGKKVKQILENNKILITAFVDNNTNKQGEKLDGIEIISYKTLCGLLKTNKKYIIQITSVYENEIAAQLEEIDANYILYSEWCSRIKMLCEYMVIANNYQLRQYYYDLKWQWQCAKDNLEIKKYLENRQLNENNINLINLMVSAPKTGNGTIQKSTDEVIVLDHSFVFIEKLLDLYKRNIKVNLIIGIRDVVSQNLSLLFEMFADNELFDIDEVWDSGGDVQSLFDKYIISNDFGKKDYWFQVLKTKLNTNYLIQDFFDQQLNNFCNINIYNYKFDKSKGFSVYEFCNLNIMIYQLEKMNKLEKEIGKFLGLNNFILKKDNESNNKWYSNYYKTAKKDILFDKKYIEESYNSQFMKHFYSAEDIENFKNKWRKNIK